MAELELARYDWSSLAACAGPATAVPAALRGLLTATNRDEQQRYYWQLENVVVVQGNLFEAAVPVASVLCAALLDDLKPAAKVGVLELLFQIVAGEPHRTEMDRGLTDLDRRAKEAASQAHWLLYEELCNGEADLANQILDAMEMDPLRYRYYLDHALKAGRKIEPLD